MKRDIDLLISRKGVNLCGRKMRELEDSGMTVGGFKKMIGKCNISKQQLKMGVRVEMEHTKNPKVAKKIAMDHLCEFPGKPYYSELKKMERRLK